MPLDPQTKVDRDIVKFLLNQHFPHHYSMAFDSIISKTINNLIKVVEKKNKGVSDDDILTEIHRIDRSHKNYLEINLIDNIHGYTFNTSGATKWVSLTGRKFLSDLKRKNSMEESSLSTTNNTYNFNGNNQIINNQSNIRTQNNNSEIAIHNESNFKNGIKKLFECKDKMSNKDKKQLSKLVDQLSLMYKSNNNKPGLLKKFGKFIKHTFPKIKSGLNIALLAIEIKNQLML